MSYRNTRRLNKSISPLGERNITPENISKYGGETMGESNINSSNNAPFLKQFSESVTHSAYSHKNRYNGNYHHNVTKEQDAFASCSLAQINLELDNNMNEIIYLFGKRKTLTSLKKKKIKEDVEDKINRARVSSNSSIYNSFEYSEDEDFLKVVDFCQNTQAAIKILSKIVTMLTNMRAPKVDEEEKSQSFWAKNRQLENQIDSMLEKLKNIDKSLEKQNKQVFQICKSLDHIEDTLKSIAGIKGQDNLQKVEPLFNSKKKNYDSLNHKVKERQKFKDSKIEYINRIRDALNHLKMIRENRLNEIIQFFGLSNVWDIDKCNFKEAGDFTKGFEQLLKIKEKQSYLSISQKELAQQIDQIEAQQDHIYNQMLRKQSDQARAYHNYSKIIAEKVKHTSILSLFGDQSSQSKLCSLNSSELTKKFSEYKNFLKRFLEQDSLIKQGLVKTNQTLDTFITLQRSIQNQKERRHELLMILETYIYKKSDYSQKKEEMRTLSIQQTKNHQKLSQYEEQLEAILSDGDIDGYKKVGSLIAKCELEKTKLNTRKQKLERQMQIMDRQVVGLASKVKEQYQDILCEIIPSDYQYELADGDDVKKLRNYLRKMYRRLGILGNQ